MRRAARSARVAGRAARTAFASLAAIGETRLAGPVPRAARAERLRRLMAEVLDIHGVRVGIDGALPTGPCVMVANHVGYLDPLIIGAQVACTALAKAEVARWPLIGAAAAKLGIVFVDRADTWSRAQALLTALRALEAGVPVLNFPEGTTTDGSRLLPFARGMFGVARLAGVPVVPIGLRLGVAELCWTGGETFLPHYARTAARPSLSAMLRIGAPLHPARFASASALAAVARREVARLLEDPRDDHDALAIPHDAGLRRIVPAARPDPVLPLADGVLRRATA